MALKMYFVKLLFDTFKLMRHAFWLLKHLIIKVLWIQLIRHAFWLFNFNQTIKLEFRKI